MRRSITLLFIFSLGILKGQTDTILIKNTQEKYQIAPGCFDVIAWDEVVLKNKKIEQKINTAIRSAVMNYKLSEDYATSRCNTDSIESGMEYDTDFDIVYAKYNLVSYYLTAFTYFEGAPHGYREFRTLNFNAKTGEQINFRDFIDTCRVQDLDTLIIHKLNERLVHFGGGEADLWKKQLAGLEYNISDKGIEILFRGDVYVLSIIGIMLTYEELKPYVNPEGLLKVFYAD